MVKVKKDLTGQRFGRLTVLRRDENDYISSKSGKKYPRWICKCDCGNVLSVWDKRLKSGETKSCGCFKSDQLVSRNRSNKKHNSYTIIGDTAIFTTSSGKNFIVDAEDANKIIGYCWRMSDDGYVKTATATGNLLLHRLLTSCPRDKVVDHINHDPSDNRKANLRIVTQAQNSMNSSPKKNEIKGVSLNSKYNSWKAIIWYKGKSHYLGSFKTKEEAVAARKKAEEKYFGEFNYNPDADVRNITAQD